MKQIILILGESGAGKSTVAQILEDEYGLRQLKSYTTRPQRSETDNTHEFISEAKFRELEDIIAYTKFGGYEYAATLRQLEAADVYVIDPAGAEFLMTRKPDGVEFIEIFLDTSANTRYARMVVRGDRAKDIDTRIYYDAVAFAAYHEEMSRRSDMHVIKCDDREPEWVAKRIYSLYRIISG